MTKKKGAGALATSFLKKKKEPITPHFQTVQTGPQNSFRTLFDISELTPQESDNIERLMTESYDVEISEVELKKDISALKSVTAEIKSINKQGVLLLGERIHQARDILQKYGDGRRPFTEWLEYTFGSRKTAYNMLSYYQFHRELPDDQLRNKLKELPLQAAYILASRDGDPKTKQKILNTYQGQKQKEIVLEIQEKLPVSSQDRRRRSPTGEALLLSLEMAGRTLIKEKIELTRGQQRRLERLINSLGRCLE